MLDALRIRQAAQVRSVKTAAIPVLRNTTRSISSLRPPWRCPPDCVADPGAALNPTFGRRLFYSPSRSMLSERAEIGHRCLPLKCALLQNEGGHTGADDYTVTFATSNPAPGLFSRNSRESPGLVSSTFFLSSFAVSRGSPAHAGIVRCVRSCVQG